jgi:hypothetical protein
VLRKTTGKRREGEESKSEIVSRSTNEERKKRQREGQRGFCVWRREEEVQESLVGAAVALWLEPSWGWRHGCELDQKRS